MTRRVFFSFHYDRDIWRVSRVRNSNVIQSSDFEGEGFIDSVSWEQLKRKGEDAIKEWINKELTNTSVTVVLIGAKTSTRDWVEYEIKQSINGTKGLLGVRIHDISDENENTDSPGRNPLHDHSIPLKNGTSQTASTYYNTYNWVTDNGRDNIGDWIEEAASLAGR